MPRRDPARPDVTAAELAVLEALWDDQPATIRMLTDRLYPDGGTSHYATVQKLLERLEAKKFVKRQRRTMPHRFRASIDRGQLIQNRLTDIADTLCGGAIAPLLTHLVGDHRLDGAELSRLRELVDRLERERNEGDDK
ncbi:MAG: BlaI/MecI/CopY family transcriptional regulator [bacterium]|nr:BlaI/MecI/CopY family transcriptional regulator [bacterium]